MQLYDQPRVNNKKTLMPKMQNSQSGETHQMVEQSLFDIYLCDNCEAELYSYEAYQVSKHKHKSMQNFSTKKEASAFVKRILIFKTINPLTN